MESGISPSSGNCFRKIKHFHCIDIECFREFVNIHYADVSDSALDFGKVCSVDSGGSHKLFLTNAFLFSELPQTKTEFYFDIALFHSK